MIKASDILIGFLRSQNDREGFMKRADISQGSYYNLVGGKDVGSDTVAKILKITGLDFEKAFEVSDE